MRRGGPLGSISILLKTEISFLPERENKAMTLEITL
jgi:hypothetical protein